MSATIGENIKLHRHCLSRKRNVHLRLANEIRFSMHGQCDAVNANCIDVVQQNSCKISADDAMSLIELYRSGLGASEMFPRSTNTDSLSTMFNCFPRHCIQFSFQSFSVIQITIFWKYKTLTHTARREIRGLTFRLKTPRQRETFFIFWTIAISIRHNSEFCDENNNYSFCPVAKLESTNILFLV